MRDKPKIAIAADVPLWSFPEFRDFNRPAGHYATWLEALAPAFRDLDDFDIHWLTFSKSVRSTLRREAMGQTFHVLPRWKKLFSMVSTYAMERIQARRELRAIRPDLLHTWGGEDAYGLIGAEFLDAPKLHTMQGCLAAVVANSPSPHWLLRLQAAYEPATIRAFSHLTGESPVSLCHLGKLNPAATLHLVDYPVSPECFGIEWRPGPDPVVLYAGAVTFPKGISELVSAMREPSLAGVRLDLAGDGPLLDTLKRDAPANVRFLGSLPRQELMERMAGAWCLAVPTHADTGPSVVKEARVIGLPVVVTRAAGAASYIEDSGAGVVVEPKDAVSLRLALTSLLEDRETCIRIGKRSHAEHRRHFHPETSAARFGEIYRELLQAQTSEITP